MKWINLKQNKCPKCNKGLMWDEAGNLYCSCKFLISQKRFREIVENQVSQQLEEDRINAEADDIRDDLYD